MFCDGLQKEPFAFANRQMDSLDAVPKRNLDKIVTGANTKELYKAVKQNKTGGNF